MFCPLCRTVFCRLVDVYLSRYSGPYSHLRVCHECATNFGEINAVWYILSLPNPKPDYRDVALYVLQMIPSNELVRWAAHWGCTTWDYAEALAFARSNPVYCHVFGRMCDRVFKEHLRV